MRPTIFGTMGRIAGMAAIGAFTGAALMLVLSLLGFAHLRRVSPDAELGGQSPPNSP
jgi:hypothetical protein